MFFYFIIFVFILHLINFILVCFLCRLPIINYFTSVELNTMRVYVGFKKRKVINSGELFQEIFLENDKNFRRANK